MEATWRHLARIGAAALLTPLLLTLALPPFEQFYLAWVAWLPLLLAANACRTPLGAAALGYGCGAVLFTAGMWWLINVTAPGAVALWLYLACYTAALAGIVRATRWLEQPHPAAIVGAALILPTTMVALDWLRATLFTGLPWLLPGQTQAPLLAGCQVADLAGIHGVSSWTYVLNALAALAWIHRRRPRALVPAVAASLAVVAFVFLYGGMRIAETRAAPGPVVAVVQSAFPQSNTGEKGASQERIVEFHLEATRRLFAEHAGEPIDLVAWSETMMPSLNPEAVTAMAGEPWGDFLVQTLQRLGALAREHQVHLLVGGTYAADWAPPILDDAGQTREHLMPRDRRNSAYLIRPDGALDPARYDKVHLVPFGEFVPFRDSIPWLYRLFMSLSPYDFDYTLTRGDDARPTRFVLPSRSGERRVVTPICFEDLLPPRVARMIRPRSPGGPKSADLIVNLTNDGWFRPPQMQQHLQLAVFRSIENRVPTARSVNMGISGFIDSVGRVHGALPVGVEGARAMQLEIDPRVSYYTRHGDVFAIACAVVAATALLLTAAARRAASVRSAAGGRTAAGKEP